VRLQFIRPHASIVSAPIETLPDFTVITGLNGSGKTHFLQALHNQAIRLFGPENEPLTHVSLHDWLTLKPRTMSTANTQQLYQTSHQALSRLRAIQQGVVRHIRPYLEARGIVVGQLATDIRATEDERLRALDAKDRSVVLQQLDSMRAQTERGLEKEPSLLALAEFNNLDLATLLRTSPEALEQPPMAATQHADLFQQDFSQLFLAYYEQQKENFLIPFYAATTGAAPANSLDPDAFVDKHGPPPWKFLNELLTKAGLDFEIDHPQGPATVTYTPTLTKKSSGATIRFQDLSSGENVLMTLALCAYSTDRSSEGLRKPDVLLFDEIDASLHPSMTQTVLDIIEKSIVDKLGIRVLLTTHSPTTAAVAPEDSLYTMTGTPPKLEKRGKQQSIGLLTQDLPTLSVDFEGRRQVLVESSLDAELLAELYRILSPELASERSLDFIPVGMRTDAGDTGTGCAVVKSLTTAFSNNGNRTVLGLVDWDAKHSPSDRVHVLCHEARYSLENVLCDPLLVIALLIRRDNGAAANLGLPPTTTSSALHECTQAELQSAVDILQRRALGKDIDADLSPFVEASYNGGQLSMRLSGEYVKLDGHTLYEKLKASFTPLRALHQERRFFQEVARNVAREHRQLIPDSVRQTLSELLSFEL